MNDLEAVRAGRWKLHVARAGAAVNELYDVVADPAESHRPRGRASRRRRRGSRRSPTTPAARSATPASASAAPTSARSVASPIRSR